MDLNLDGILNRLPVKPPRSRLEPHLALITEMRKRSRSYREIAQVLRDAYCLTVGTSTIHDFVRSRSKPRPKPGSAVSKKRANSAVRTTEGIVGSTKESKGTQSTARYSKDAKDLAKKFKYMKQRSARPPKNKPVFAYNPDEPLRLQHLQRSKE